MMKRFLSLLLLGTILSGSGVALAENKVIEVKKGEKYVSSDDIFDIEEPTTLINNGELETTDTGNIFNMDTHPDDTINLSGSIVENHGTMKTSGAGHSVYAYPLQNQRSTTTVYNYGDMSRIELSETGKSARSFLGEGSQVYNYEGANLYGSVRLGTNATLENWGSMANLDGDDKENFAYNNLIYFDKNGVFKSGLKEEVVTDELGTHLWVDLTPAANISTNNVIFGQSGTLNNAGIIQNERITAFDSRENAYQRGVKIYLMSNPYYETDDVVRRGAKIDRYQAHLKYFTDVAKEGSVSPVFENPVLRTNKISLGDDATFRADQGSDISVYDSLSVNKGADINIGADYYWLSNLYKDPVSLNTYNWTRQITAWRETAEEITYEETVGDTVINKTKYILGEPEEVKVTLNEVPLRSMAMISELKTGDDATITIKNTDLSNSYADADEKSHIGGSVTLGKNASVDIEGSTVSWQKKDKDKTSGNMKFDENGNFKLAGYIQDKVVLSDNDIVLVRDTEDCPDGLVCVKNEYVESVIDPEGKSTWVELGGNLNMKKNAYLELHSESKVIDKVRYTANANLNVTGNITLGDNSTIQGTGNGSVPNFLYADSLTFANHGTYDGFNIVGNVNKDLKFGNFGTFTNGSSFIAGGNAIFKDDGVFNATALFKAKKLDMNERSTINVYDTLDVEAWVHNDSVVNLFGVQDARVGPDAGITNGLFKKEGAKNVVLNSTTGNLNTEEDKKPIFNENFLLNGVDVDHIYIKSGGLRLGPDDTYQTDVTVKNSGDIHGIIHMASNTWVRFTGNNIKIYDPIKKDQGATNTLVWIDVDDTAVINTRNTIDSDKVMIGGGTLNAKHKITAPEVILDDAGGLRVFDTDLIHADVHEYETTAANTTLFIHPEKDVMDSFGSVQADRLYIEKGTFNANHPIVAASDGTKQTKEGIWLDTNTAINVNNQVHASQVFRPRSEETGTVTNTTARLLSGSLIVDRHVDVDNLILKAGTFQFKNTGNVETEGLNRDMIVTNDVTVEKGVDMLIDGSSHPNSGKVIIGGGNGSLTVKEGARLGLSNDLLAESDTPGQMNLKANLNVEKGSVLDLRTSDAGSDLISSDKSINLENRVRLIVRKMKEQTDYHLMHADGGANIPSNFEVSFRWHDTNLYTPNNQDVYLNVGHITTLKEELDQASVSRNVKGIGGYISDIWDGAYGPWDDIFYASTLGDAVKVISQYIPEGYVNAPQVAMRTGANYNNVMLAELDDMRQLSTPGAERSRIAPSMQNRRPVYRGRAGGDTYYTRPVYQPYVRNKYQAYEPNYGNRSSFRGANHGSYRTDKGGLWAKPFYIMTTQDKNKGISGYDYDSYGLAVGLDHRFGQWTWGLSGLYAQGDFEQDNRVITTDVTSWGVGLYGSFRPNKSGFFTDLYASYVQNSNKATHKISSVGAKLKANYDTTSLGAGIAFGYDLALAKSLYLTPKVGFNYARLSSDDIKEKGTAPLVAKVKNPNVNSMQLPIELRVAFPVMAQRFELLPELHVRYTHDFGDTEYRSKAYMNGSDTYIKLDNVGMPENWFTLGGSIGYTTGSHELSGRYDYDFGDGLTSHLFNLGYKYLF